VHRGMKCAQCMKIRRSFLVVPIACWTNTIGKVCDFGLSMIFTDSAVCNPTPVGTPKCTVPELLHNELVTHKRDVFSLGVIICKAHHIETSLALARCQASGHNWVTLVPHSGLNFYQLSAEILIWSNFGSSGTWYVQHWHLLSKNSMVNLDCQVWIWQVMEIPIGPFNIHF
jgi:serine/threonine protein kinase